MSGERSTCQYRPTTHQSHLPCQARAHPQPTRRDGGNTLPLHRAALIPCQLLSNTWLNRSRVYRVSPRFKTGNLKRQLRPIVYDFENPGYTLYCFFHIIQSLFKYFLLQNCICTENLQLVSSFQPIGRAECAKVGDKRGNEGSRVPRIFALGIKALCHRTLSVAGRCGLRLPTSLIVFY